MQGRQYVANLERKGPHKSMHCKFCKPPGVVTPEKPARPTLETKTKFHLTHEAADLSLCEVHDEPGLPIIESEACVCVLEGDSSCPKCVPDKTREPVKKKTCRCPKGAKPHSSMLDGTTPKKKKKKEEDEEFWWEKYSREHDAIAKETWAAYMSQRRKEKKMSKIQSKMIYVEFLSRAIRWDSDENTTDRTYFVLAGLGLYPRPKRKIIEKCIKYCHYNSIQFLNQFLLLTKDLDPFEEKKTDHCTQYLCTWNERLVMTSLCYLEFPALLREIMDRLPPLRRDKVLPQIPYPVFPKRPEKIYNNPYEEPIWEDRINWVDKMKIDRINIFRAHMNDKRVKIPPLALVRRPSLIDARPPFIAQYQAQNLALRIKREGKEKKVVKKHPKRKFDSDVDVTAIAEIEASDTSMTDKADLDDLCVFLRDPLKDAELIGEGEGEEEGEGDEEEMGEGAAEDDIQYILDKNEKFPEEETEVLTTDNNFKILSETEDSSAPEEIPFVTPPKTKSGTTIVQPCNPPETSPAPPALHYYMAKRDLDIVNEEICGFYPFVTSSTQTVDPHEGDKENEEDNTTLRLISAAQKLQEFAEVRETSVYFQPLKKTKLIKKKKKKKNKQKSKQESQSPPKKGKKTQLNKNATKRKQHFKKREGEYEEENEEIEEEEEEEEEVLGEVDLSMVPGKSILKSKLQKTDSELSDPDPASEDDDVSAKRPCPQLEKTSSELLTKEKSRVRKGKKRRGKKKSKRKNTPRTMRQRRMKREKNKKKVKNITALREESLEYIKKTQNIVKLNKTTMTECYPGEYDYLYGKPPQQKKEKKAEDYSGNPFPLLTGILKDLADEGYISASYPFIEKHPDIDQLIQHLQGKILTTKMKHHLHITTKDKWENLKVDEKFQIQDLGISPKKVVTATWNDKRWISKLADNKLLDFYFKVAKTRADYGKEFYNTLSQNFILTGRFMKIFYAYMVSKYEDAILKGPDGIN